MRLKYVGILVAASAALSGEATAKEGRDLWTLIDSKPQLSTMANAIKSAGLSDALRDGDKKLTLFAPTNEAFAKLPAAELEMLLKPENKNKLIEVLRYHLVVERCVLLRRDRQWVVILA
jgi:uncharacterized surface protein with fasciclin (FAS1) repeats